jgi:hypothetical protein
MWLYWLFFFFVAFGAKVLLAFVMIYLLLPTDRSCVQCDEETLLVRMNRLGRFGSLCSGGRVQWRWCPRCGWEGLARRGVARRPSAARPAGNAAATRR